MGTVKEEHVMRCEVTGGFVEVRYVHDMSAEDVVDLIAYLDVLRRHLLKRTTPKCPKCGAMPGEPHDYAQCEDGSASVAVSG